MDMEGTEEFVGSSTNNDTTQTAKGKRTKRPRRPSSPDGVVIAATTTAAAAATTTTVTTSSSSSAAGGGHVVSGGRGGDGCGSFSSTTISYESTEEEEDMANCLILLAQGGGPKQIGNIYKVEKFSSSPKFADIATTITSTTTKTGFYVYECKTCNRTFPSFQALGGHRASHKKPKTTVDEKKPPTPPPQPPPPQPSQQQRHAIIDDLEESSGKTQIRFGPHQISIQLSTGGGNRGFNSTNKVKIHECSICGSEFTSGQALGGHMRRHRTATSTGANTATPTVDIKPRNILQLDLNLPAPEDDHRDSKFQFNPTKQSLVLSAPALVDCHY
ncbi:Zinc finger protein [Quillaja saponaria]|uniref:Zinc finger protein n=1 Tax=Quillaja saponaria TaxID=32244 RepID=A0AAD7PA52_QUISA|nr:Zinc finger protein [Quillaja saponaria]